MSDSNNNLPELPEGWIWRGFFNGVICASHAKSGSDVYIDSDGVNIEGAPAQWWAPTEVVLAVLLANGYSLTS